MYVGLNLKGILTKLPSTHFLLFLSLGLCSSYFFCLVGYSNGQINGPFTGYLLNIVIYTRRYNNRLLKVVRKGTKIQFQFFFSQKNKSKVLVLLQNALFVRCSFWKYFLLLLVNNKTDRHVITVNINVFNRVLMSTA